jgi:hypothetical protein
MTHHQEVVAAIVALAILSYALRAGGFVLAGWVSPDGTCARLLQRAPGNLFVAFAVVGAATGGLPVFIGIMLGLGAAVFIKHEVAVLGFGAAGVALMSWLF